MNIDSLSFTWCLVAAESRIWKQSGVQDVQHDSELCRGLKMLKMFKDLSESKCSRTRGEMSAGHQRNKHYNLLVASRAI